MNKFINKEVFNAIQNGNTCRFIDCGDSYAISTDGIKLLKIKKEDLIVDTKHMKEVEKIDIQLTKTSDDKEIVETGNIFKRNGNLLIEYSAADGSSDEFKIYIDKSVMFWKTRVKLLAYSKHCRVLVLDFMTDSVIGCIMPCRFDVKREGNI
jgi:hypothetical protein